jgi:hypothetical protein
VRGWLPLFFASVAVFVLWTFFTGAFPNLYRHPRFFAVTVAVLVAMVIVWDALVFLARRELKRTGLSAADRNRVMLSMPPGRASFWARPHIAAVLLPAADAEVPQSDSPHDQLQSILRNSGELAGPLRPLGGEAAVAARQLLVSIGELDRDIAQLARSVEPGENERLEEKIAILEEGDELRALLVKQLELVRGIGERIEEAKEKRNRRLETLKALALHVAALRARTAGTATDVSLITERVRALCDEIARQGAAAGLGSDEMATVKKV